MVWFVSIVTMQSCAGAAFYLWMVTVVCMYLLLQV